MVGRRLTLMAMGGLWLLAPDARAAVASGFIQARMVITASCEVSKGTDVAPVSPTGGTAMLDFGSQGPTWSNPLAAGMSAGDNAPLMVSCNPTVASFTVTIDGGTNAVGTTRRLSNGRQTIAYHLMADPLGRIPYSIGEQRSFVASNGTQMTIPVWGAVVANTTALPAGTYTDTLTVTLDW
ncbi:spore coat U domain-containing protein [Pseudomonas trivialis]|uniref:Csu type fimbrial protein n=1 Tax=Pseudomonas trivialis TaxID=200450 RepID=UPI0030D0E867